MPKVTNTRHRTAGPATTVILLGVATVVAQALLLREAMAAMGGSEIAWGLVMALWLGGMGTGARIGVRFGSPDLARWLPPITLALACGGALLFRGAPAILGTTTGETLTTWHAVWLWALAVVPAAAAGGLAFPILAAGLGDRGPGRGYALEATGALIGGTVLTVALVPLGTAAAFLITIAAVAGTSLWPRHRGIAAAVALTCAASALPVADLAARHSWEWTNHPGELAHWKETRHQRLEASEGPPTAVYADGRLLASYPDPYATLAKAHLMMLLHPAPRRVVAIGCSADGSVEAMIRHPLTELVLVDEDPQLMGLLERWYGTAFRTIVTDSKVSIRSDDPLRVLRRIQDIDLVILANGDPTTLRANRTRTVEFLRSARRAMNRSGILIMRVGVGDTYLGGAAGDLVAILASTLREVFPRVTALPGESVLLVAGASEAPLELSLDELLARRLDRPEIGDQMHPALLPVLLDEGRRAELTDFVVAARRPPNTVQHPRAVPVATILHEARSRHAFTTTHPELARRLPGVLGAATVLASIGLIGVALVGTVSLRATAAAAVVGFTSMGWWLLLLATWQATRGSVYAEVGALTGIFMAGVAVGGWWSHRSAHQIQSLPWLLAAGACLSMIVATGAATRVPWLLVPCLLAAGGALAGAAFPGLGELAGHGVSRQGAGRAFAADEVGAAAAALVIGTVAIPWVGMAGTAIALTVLGLTAIPTLLAIRARFP